MPVYIVPFRNPEPFLDKAFNGPDLCHIYYKDKAGPLGFLRDDFSRTLFITIVSGSIWYISEQRAFQLLSRQFMKDNKFKVWGLIFPDGNLVEQMDLEQRMKIAALKNNILRRHNRCLHTEEPTLFTSLRSVNLYRSDTIEELARVTDFSLIVHDEFGRSFITPQSSVYMEVCIRCCKEFKVELFYVKSHAEVPPW